MLVLCAEPRLPSVLRDEREVAAPICGVQGAAEPFRHCRALALGRPQPPHVPGECSSWALHTSLLQYWLAAIVCTGVLAVDAAWTRCNWCMMIKGAVPTCGADAAAAEQPGAGALRLHPVHVLAAVAPAPPAARREPVRAAAPHRPQGRPAHRCEPRCRLPLHSLCCPQSMSNACKEMLSP